MPNSVKPLSIKDEINNINDYLENTSINKLNNIIID